MEIYLSLSFRNVRGRRTEKKKTYVYSMFFALQDLPNIIDVESYCYSSHSPSASSNIMNDNVRNSFLHILNCCLQCYCFDKNLHMNSDIVEVLSCHLHDAFSKRVRKYNLINSNNFMRYWIFSIEIRQP